MHITRSKLGRALAGLAALGYVATAWIHGTGFDSVTRLAREGPADLVALMPALWLVVSLDLVVFGLVIALVAWRPEGAGRMVVAAAALNPFGAAGLQLRFLGFIPPTAILLTIGCLAAAAAAVLPGRGSARTRH